MGIFNKRKPMIRFIYIDFEKKYELKNKKLDIHVNEKFILSDALYIPEGLEYRDLCVLLSYLFERVENEPVSPESIEEVIDRLKKIGFQCNHSYKQVWYQRVIEENKFGKDEHKICKSIPDCIDIFLVGSKDNLLSQTKLNRRFIEWYIPNTTYSEFSRIQGVCNKNKKIH